MERKIIEKYKHIMKISKLLLKHGLKKMNLWILNLKVNY